MMQIQQRPSAANTEASIFHWTVKPLWWGLERTLWPNIGLLYNWQGTPCKLALGVGLNRLGVPASAGALGRFETPPLVYTR